MQSRIMSPLRRDRRIAQIAMVAGRASFLSEAMLSVNRNALKVHRRC